MKTAFKGSRIQVKGMEIKTLEPSNPGILEPCFCVKSSVFLFLPGANLKNGGPLFTKIGKVIKV